jgi:cathepsin A (carboxypeptidase C)
MYSGYLDLQVDAGKEISIHYVFITSMNKPATDDLVMWFNGGPGCSSLLGRANL